MYRVREVNTIFLTTVILAIVASFFAEEIPIIRDNQLFRLLLSQVVYASPMFIYLVTSRISPWKALRIKPLRLGTILLLVVFAYAITPLLSLLNAISMLFATNVINNTLMGIVTESPLLVAITAIALIPCILEESVYRGVFFNEYRKINPRKGILMSGLLFGLLHLNFNQFIYAFVMGIIFALLVEATDSLLASMIVHFTINADSILLSRFMPQQRLVEQAAMLGNRAEVLKMIGPLTITATFMTAAAVGILYLIAGMQERRETLKAMFIKGNKTGETILTLPLLLGITICLIIMIYIEIASHM